MSSRKETARISVFYSRKGQVKVTVVSEHGKETVVAILGNDDFAAKDAKAGQPKRLASATARTECEIMRIEKDPIVRTLHDEPDFRSGSKKDPVDQLFNSSEKRLARAFLLLAKFWQGS
jgi:CRP/FNR family cyclic AMP-dependent transcriptional regulator